MQRLSCHTGGGGAACNEGGGSLVTHCAGVWAVPQRNDRMEGPLDNANEICYHLLRCGTQ